LQEKETKTIPLFLVIMCILIL